MCLSVSAVIKSWQSVCITEADRLVWVEWLHGPRAHCYETHCLLEKVCAHLCMCVCFSAPSCQCKLAQTAAQNKVVFFYSPRVHVCIHLSAVFTSASLVKLTVMGCRFSNELKWFCGAVQTFKKQDCGQSDNKETFISLCAAALTGNLPETWISERSPPLVSRDKGIYIPWLMVSSCSFILIHCIMRNTPTLIFFCLLLVCLFSDYWPAGCTDLTLCLFRNTNCDKSLYTNSNIMAWKPSLPHISIWVPRHDVHNTFRHFDSFELEHHFIYWDSRAALHEMWDNRLSVSWIYNSRVKWCSNKSSKSLRKNTKGYKIPLQLQCNKASRRHHLYQTCFFLLLIWT